MNLFLLPIPLKPKIQIIQLIIFKTKLVEFYIFGTSLLDQIALKEYRNKNILSFGHKRQRLILGFTKHKS